MWDELKEDLRFERSQLERTLDEVRGLLSGEKWDKADTALAAILLHGFYNGVEKCLEWLARADGRLTAKNDAWHQELLRSFAHERGFPHQGLRELLSFRHVFRHSYHFDLRPDRVRELAVRLGEVGPEFLAWLGTRTEALP